MLKLLGKLKLVLAQDFQTMYILTAKRDAKLQVFKVEGPKKNLNACQAIIFSNLFLDLQFQPPTVLQSLEMQGCILSYLKVLSQKQLLFA